MIRNFGVGMKPSESECQLIRDTVSGARIGALVGLLVLLVLWVFA